MPMSSPRVRPWWAKERTYRTKIEWNKRGIAGEGDDHGPKAFQRLIALQILVGHLKGRRATWRTGRETRCNPDGSECDGPSTHWNMCIGHCKCQIQTFLSHPSCNILSHVHAILWRCLSCARSGVDTCLFSYLADTTTKKNTLLELMCPLCSMVQVAPSCNCSLPIGLPFRRVKKTEGLILGRPLGGLDSWLIVWGVLAPTSEVGSSQQIGGKSGSQKEAT